MRILTCGAWSVTLPFPGKRRNARNSAYKKRIYAMIYNSN
jgi:hypothetical protein